MLSTKELKGEHIMSVELMPVYKLYRVDEKMSSCIFIDFSDVNYIMKLPDSNA